jgi:hypothetical protein
MTEMLFFIRYRTQLRKTRPDIIPLFELSLDRLMEKAGGVIKNRRRFLEVSFDDSSLAFWLDILIALESIIQSIERVQDEFYGYALVIGAEAPEEKRERLCRLLAAGGGIWFGAKARQSLSPYIYFEKAEDKDLIKGRLLTGEDAALIKDYVRLKGIKNFRSGAAEMFPFREMILRALDQDAFRNTLVVGPGFSGKRDGIYHHCSADGNPALALVVRFGTGRGLGCLADAWSAGIRLFLKDIVPGALEELDSLGSRLFRERLRSEISEYMFTLARRFFALLVDVYTSALKGKGLKPVLILENIHRAESAAAEIVAGVYAAFSGRESLMVYGTCDSAPAGKEEKLKFWNAVFPRIIQLNADNYTIKNPELPRDLWEIAYAQKLLGEFFPGVLFKTLFEEEGKNPELISRAQSMLAGLGIIDTVFDPQPRISDFVLKAERALGDRKEKVRALVCRRLLAWVKRNRLKSCFELLETLSRLGYGKMVRKAAEKDEIVLRSVYADLVNGTWAAMDKAVKDGVFGGVVGPEREGTVRRLIEAEKVLMHGDESAIKGVFKEPSGIEPSGKEPDPPDFYPPYKAMTLTSRASYCAGRGDLPAALDAVKEAIVLSQNREWSGLARSYRLFALVNLAKQQIGEALDYITFAVESTEKSGDMDELGVSAYYAAASQFLYGNLSKAERLAKKAEESASLSGRSGWACRARFLRGKLAFELGCYRDALDTFESLRKNSAAALSGEQDKLLAAWSYRSKVYSQSPLIQKPAEESPDADLFEIEASYLAGNYRKTVDLCGRFAENLPPEHFNYIEQPDWSSGFAQCELLLLPQKELWNRMISVYRSMALCRISSGGSAEAVQIMQQILREEGLSSADTNDSFYFYAWYRVLEDSKAAQADMNTAVSMAFKRLQRRASRIDDMETRRIFLSHPRWNGMLSKSAREYKLI